MELGIATYIIIHFAYIPLISGVKSYNNNIVFTIKLLFMYRKINKKYEEWMKLKNIYRKKVNLRLYIQYKSPTS